MPDSNIFRIEAHRAIFEIPLDKHIIVVQGDTLEGEGFLLSLLDEGYDLAKYSPELNPIKVHNAEFLSSYFKQGKFNLFYIQSDGVSRAWHKGELDKLIDTIEEHTEEYFVLHTRNSHLHFENQSEVGYYVFDVDASGEKDIIRLKPVENQYTIRGYLDDLRLIHGVE